MMIISKGRNGGQVAILPPMEDQFIKLIVAELNRAVAKHPPMRSSAEAYAVILEEFQEWWEEVRKQTHQQDKARILAELIQVAAMCWRAANDLGLLGENPSVMYSAEEFPKLDAIPLLPLHPT